jgi:hypothetical protein
LAAPGFALPFTDLIAAVKNSSSPSWCGIALNLDWLNGRTVFLAISTRRGDKRCNEAEILQAAGRHLRQFVFDAEQNFVPGVGWQSNLRRKQMSKKAAEHHKKASQHSGHASKHHAEAAKHHEAGRHEKAAHHAHTASAHDRQSRMHADEAAKAHAEDHGEEV